MKQVRVAVVGSRTIKDKEFVFQQLDYYLSRLIKDYEVIIVSGGANVKILTSIWKLHLL